MDDDINEAMDAWVDHLNRMGIFAGADALQKHLERAIDQSHEMAVWLRLILVDYASIKCVIGSA